MRLLDLFCGAGGAAMGYQRAGFDVVGVDHESQPDYPFERIEDDALVFMHQMLRGKTKWNLDDFDAIHASPPCQRWTRAQRQRKNGDEHPDLVTPLRPLLREAGKRYVIENVEYCDVLWQPATTLLCGSMFDLDVQNHRLFETNWGFAGHHWPCRHGIWGRHRFPGTPQGSGKRPGAMVVNRMASGVTHQMFADAMGIDWIPSHGRKRPSKALSEAIPPAFTQYIGHELRLILPERVA